MPTIKKMKLQSENIALKMKSITADNSIISMLEVGFSDNEGNHLGDLVLAPTGVTWFKGKASVNGKSLAWEAVSNRKGQRLITF